VVNPQTSLKKLGDKATISTTKSRTDRIRKTPTIHKEINVDDLTVGTIQIEDYNPSGRFSELDYSEAPSLRIDRTYKQNKRPPKRLTTTGENSWSSAYFDKGIERRGINYNSRIKLLGSAYKTKAKKSKEMSNSIIDKHKSSFGTFSLGKKYSQVFGNSKNNSEIDMDMTFSDLMPRLDMNGNLQSTESDNNLTAEYADDSSTPSMTVYSKRQKERSLTPGLRSK
jgi:hypothetical protein